LKEQKRKLKKA